MIPITAGMTGAQFIAALNNDTKEYNVKDYGALGDGNQNDTTYIQDAINACITAGGGIVYFPNGIYIINGSLQTDIGGLNPNSQLYIPAKISTDADRCAITLLGESVPAGFPVGGSIAGAGSTYSKGVILKSTLTSASGTLPSVIGVVPEVFPALGVPWIAVETEIKNILIYVDALEGGNGPCLNGINGSFLHSLRIYNTTVSIDVEIANSVLPSADVAGIIIGLCNCSYPNEIKCSTVVGFKNGIISGEHTYLSNLFVYGCETAYIFSAGNYTTIASFISYHWCKYGLGFQSSSLYGGNLPAQLKISMIEIETYSGGKWFDTSYVVNDPSNKLFGEVNFEVALSGTPGYDNTQWTKNGGQNLRCYPIALPVASFTVTGSKGSNAALTSLISALAAKGLIIDSTT